MLGRRRPQSDFTGFTLGALARAYREPGLNALDHVRVRKLIKQRVWETPGSGWGALSSDERDGINQALGGS